MKLQIPNDKDIYNLTVKCNIIFTFTGDKTTLDQTTLTTWYKLSPVLLSKHLLMSAYWLAILEFEFSPATLHHFGVAVKGISIVVMTYQCPRRLNFPKVNYPGKNQSLNKSVSPG